MSDGGGGVRRTFIFECVSARVCECAEHTQRHSAAGSKKCYLGSRSEVKTNKKKKIEENSAKTRCVRIKHFLAADGQRFCGGDQPESRREYSKVFCCCCCYFRSIL